MTAKAAAIVPVKHLATAKSRLAERLSTEERRDLVLALFRHSLGVLSTSTRVSRIIVVTPDTTVAGEAQRGGAQVLRQEGDGINPAIRLGLAAARAAGERSCLVLLADLPLLAVKHVDAMIEMAGPDTLVLAPDRHEQGTNGLVTGLGNDFEPAFGSGSLVAHRQQAARRGWAVREYRAAGTALDLDAPADLDEYLRLKERV